MRSTLLPAGSLPQQVAASCSNNKLQQVATSSELSQQMLAKSSSLESSPCPQSVSPHLPPTPPSSRSPPTSRLSPLPSQNGQQNHQQQQQPQQQQHRVLPFSIDNILRPDFGNGKSDYLLPRPQCSRSPDSPELILRTPPKTPDTPSRHDSPVDLSHKNSPHPLHLLSGNNKANNERLLSHSINLLINPHNHPAIHPLQHHLQQQLLQHHVNPHLQHPLITKPIPLSTTTAFQLFKPLSNLAEHQKRLQQHQLQLEQHQQQLNIIQQKQHSKQHQQSIISHDGSLQSPQHHKEESLFKDQPSTQHQNSSSAGNKPHSTPMSIPSPTPSTCSTTSSCSTTSTSSSSKGSSSGCSKSAQPASESLDELVNPKIPEDNTNWPAWVYCTRYSDRPSSGMSF